jgi:hypothetical protein
MINNKITKQTYDMVTGMNMNNENTSEKTKEKRKKKPGIKLPPPPRLKMHVDSEWYTKDGKTCLLTYQIELLGRIKRKKKTAKEGSFRSRMKKGMEEYVKIRL